MSLFASLGAATLEYSTRERRAALRRPLNLWDSHSLSGSKKHSHPSEQPCPA